MVTRGMKKKSPQLENGYLKFANELFDAIIKFRIPGVERQCFDFIARKTFGFGKTWDRISNSQFVAATGVKKANVSKAINSLIDKKLVIKKDNKGIPSYRINKDYSQWKVLSKKITLSKSITGVIKKHNKSLSKNMDTKDIKNNITKDTLFDVFEFWNANGIIVHRKMTAKIKGHIKSKLEVYSKDEIFKTIENYAEILNSKEHWPTYKWTLSEFFTRENGFEKYHDDAKPFTNFRSFKKGGNGKTNIPDNVDPEKKATFEKLILIASGKAGHEIVSNYANIGESTEAMQKRAFDELERLRRG